MSFHCQYLEVNPPGEPPIMILLPTTVAGITVPICFCEKHRLEYLAQPDVLVTECPRCLLEATERQTIPIEWEATGSPLRGVINGLAIVSTLVLLVWTAVKLAGHGQ